MSAVHQLMSASLAGIFAVSLFLASHVFAEHWAAKQPAFRKIDVTRRSL